jgi:hypothetical protein
MCSGFLINLSLAIITTAFGFLAWFSYFTLCTNQAFVAKVYISDACHRSTAS